MHKHDLDLIAEYAGGSLRDDSAARSLVESCETCAAEFTKQKAVLVALGGISPARMTEHEKAGLHRDLWTELRSAGSMAPVPARGWQSWAFGAAAAVLLAVAFVGVLNNMGGADQTADTFTDAGSALDDGAGQITSDATDEAAAGEESAAPASGEPETLSDPDGPRPYAEIARQVREQSTEDFENYSFQRAELECLERNQLDDHELVGGFESMTDLLVVVPRVDDLSDVSVFFIEPDTCTVVHIEG